MVKNTGLAALRRQIDAIDRILLSQLAKREKVSEKIGELKRSEGLDVFDPKRWSDVLRSRITLGRAKKLSPEFVRLLFELIHEESMRIQKKK